MNLGRAVAQAVSRWLPTAAGQHVVFVMDKAAMGQVFSEYFGSLPIIIPSISPSS
jgi:hypothetical protein